MHEAPLVVFSGGGTGGHLYPALAIADALRELRPDVRAVFVGAERGVEARVLPARGEDHVLLRVYGFDRRSVLGSLRAAWGLAWGLARAVRLLRRLRPEVVVVTGGYAGAAAGIAAGLMGVPLVLQEQNSVPGAVTKLLTRFARRVHVAFPEARAHLPAGGKAARVTGNPVRQRYGGPREQARALFDLPSDAPVVIVLGGSQGSLAINRVMTDFVRAVVRGELSRPSGLHLLWVTGPGHHAGVVDSLGSAAAVEWVHPVPYIEEMPAALACADAAVSRAGAMTTAELLNQGLPAILIPLPSAAADHQSHNARALAEAGAAVFLSEADASAAALADALGSLFLRPDTLAGMAARASDRARPDAADAIAADIVTLISPARAA